MTHSMPLSALEPRQSGRILDVDEANPNTLRLAELGLVAGNRVEVLRRAPLGDPIHISVMRHELCLRLHDARSVLVEPVSPES